MAWFKRHRQHESIGSYEIPATPVGRDGDTTVNGGKLEQVRLRSLSELPAAADQLIATTPITVNLNYLDPKARKEAVTFLSGVVYALNGSAKKVGPKTYHFQPTPSSVLD